MLKKIESYFSSCWPSFFSGNTHSHEVEFDVFRNEGLDETLPLIPKKMESSELFIISRSLLGDYSGLNLIGPISDIQLNDCLKRQSTILTNSKPSILFLHVNGHWVSCFLLPNQSQMHCILVDSLNETQGSFRKYSYQTIFNLLKRQFPSFSSSVLYTSHQTNHEICGLCSLLFLQRTLAALKQGMIIDSKETLRTLLIKPSDGDTAEDRERFVCSIRTIYQGLSYPTSRGPVIE